ncbi:MAG: hypothetical protein JST05_03250 [Acidobacteria bacterium]|nr:hypothetical protein [Acidobacteriota bacterium]
MKIYRLCLTALIKIASLGAQCPDNGQILVLKQDKGIQLVRFFGKDSIKGFFPGHDFTWVLADKHNPEPTFWIDGFLVEWAFFPQSEYMRGKATNDRESVEAYYKYETDYLKAESRRPVSSLHIERFLNEEDKATDGSNHTFLIWSATPGEGSIKQFWIATVHPRGIVTMSVIPKSHLDDTRMKTLIDSYMASYAILRPDEETTYMTALHTFEKSKGQSQVQTMRRKRINGSKFSISIPPAAGPDSH